MLFKITSGKNPVLVGYRSRFTEKFGSKWKLNLSLTAVLVVEIKEIQECFVGINNKLNGFHNSAQMIVLLAVSTKWSLAQKV